MKAKELISIFEKNTDAEILVSTTEYYEGATHFAGYQRGEFQPLKAISFDIEKNSIQLNGARELEK
ncbi:TPA: hypothetical protein ACWWDF_002432 [Enterococcus faecium]